MSMFHNRLNSLKHVQHFIAHTSNKKKEKEKKKERKKYLFTNLQNTCNILKKL